MRGRVSDAARAVLLGHLADSDEARRLLEAGVRSKIPSGDEGPAARGEDCAASEAGLFQSRVFGQVLGQPAMTNAKAERIIQRIGDVVRPAMLTRFRPDCCVATARALTRTFERVGVAAEPVPVTVAVFSPGFFDALKREGAPKWGDRTAVVEWCNRTGVYSVGAGPGAVPGLNGFNGHVVVRVPRLSIILDGSIDQMNRPERGIVLPPAFALRLGRREAEFVRREPVSVPLGACYVCYQRIDDFSFQNGPDWRETSRTDEIVDALVRAAKG
jgi:hypothetical protein